MKDHELRVVEEQKELDTKLLALYMFIGMEIFPKLPEQEQTLLKRQHAAMHQYNEILKERIKLFTK